VLRALADELDGLMSCEPHKVWLTTPIRTSRQRALPDRPEAAGKIGRQANGSPAWRTRRRGRTSSGHSRAKATRKRMHEIDTSIGEVAVLDGLFDLHERVGLERLAEQQGRADKQR
jgi:hypothetical protein